MTNPRAVKVAEALKEELAAMIRDEVRDPRVGAAGLLTVTRVEVSDDLSRAKVFVSFVGGPPHAVGPALRALGRVAGWLGGEAGRRLRLRRAPALVFLHDRSGEHAQRIERLLKGEDE